MCAKRCYTSPKQARLANLTNHKRLRVYWCREHHAFHVTTQAIYSKRAA